jgi:hypothetical protein
MSDKKAQAIVDYMIVLIIVLIIAMLVIIFLGFVPEFAQDIRIKHSQDFWNKHARPFSISNIYYDNDYGRLYLAITSHDDDKIILRAIKFSDTQLAYTDYLEGSYQGVGALRCPKASCQGVSCDCTLKVGAHETVSIVTEPYSNSVDVCGTNERNGELNLTLVYSRNNEQSLNLSQTSNIPVAFYCH